MQMRVGTRLGAYEIVGSIGQGGMGEVYRARDTRLDRIVALKLLPPEFAADSDRRRRFEQEARAVAALNHPNVVSVYDVGENYFICELLEGESLRGVRLSVRATIDVAAQIAEGLAAAHAAGIVHRDLKPDNIVLTRDGHAKILDFGLAKVDPARSGNVTHTLTDAGTVVGTAGYMSPEQIRGQVVDQRSDIFSFGLVLYELLSGGRAFQRDTPVESMAAIVNEEPPDLPSTVPGALSLIVARCMAKQPANRFQSAKDLAFALRALSGSQIVPGLQEESRYINRWMMATAVIAVLLVMSLWALFRERPRESDRGAVRLSMISPPGTSFTEAGAVISPDGRMVAFIAAAPGKQTLWVRALDWTEAKEVPGTEGASYPFWSPDSKSIAFFGARMLKRVRVSGGLPEKVCAAPAGRGGSWGSTGTIVFAPSAGSGLQHVAVAGGEPKPITQLNASRQETEHRWPHFLPDGNRFLYWALSAKAEERGVYASSISAPHQNVHVVRTNFRAEFAPNFAASDEHLVWIRGEALVAQPFDAAKLRLHGDVAEISSLVGTGALGFAHFSVSTNGILLYAAGQFGKRNLELWDRRGAAIMSAAYSGIYYAPRVSPDGSRVAIARVEPPNTDIWAYEFGRGTMVRLTVEPGFDNMPVWSPSGSKLVFSAARDGARNLYTRNATGTGEERLTQSSYPQYPSDWSRDGRYVVFTEGHPTTDGDIWLAPADGASRPVKPEPFLVTPFNETHGRLSPDGKWIAYSSNQSGRYEVYVQTFPATGQSWSVSQRGGTHPVWRGDGRELFYISDNSRLMSVDVAAVGRGLTLSQPHELFAVPVRIGESFYDYDVMPDGKQFLILPHAVGTTEPLTLLINWHAARQQ